MILNKKNIIMVALFYIFVFFVKAEATVKNSEFWNYSYSFYYGLQGEASRDYFDSFLNDKYITINNKKIKINNDCEFDYYQVEKKPISYWMSNKTVNYYTEIFNEKKIKIGNEISVFYPENPNDICGEKYGDFLLVDNKLINITYEKIDIYLKVNEKPTLSFWCESEDNAEEFEFKSYCYFINKNISDAYKDNYNVSIKNGEMYLLGKVNKGENLNKVYGNESGDNSVFVSYKWDGDRKLIIEQQFPGGNKEIILEENNNGFNGTKITTIDRPD